MSSQFAPSNQYLSLGPPLNCRSLFAQPPTNVMPRLHQVHMSPGNIPVEQHVSGYIYVDGYKLLIRDTLTVSRRHITIHLCHGRLVSLCIQQQTDDKLATILSPIRRRQVDTTCIRQHVSWCKTQLKELFQSPGPSPFAVATDLSFFDNANAGLNCHVLYQCQQDVERESSNTPSCC